MGVEFDPAKDATNLAKHGISLRRASEIVIQAFIEDDRFAYGEPRYRAYGLIDDVPHCLVYTMRDGHIRAISLRRARQKEVRRYVLRRKPTD